jgi:ankyrin repeat protein
MEITEKEARKMLNKRDIFIDGNGLSYYSYHGDIHTVELILKAGVSPNAIGWSNAKESKKLVPLKQALWKGHVEVAKLLIMNGASMELEDGFGRSGFCQSIFNNDAPLVEFMIDAGAVLDKIGSDDKSPLTIAIDCNSPEIVQLLIEKGANVNRKNKKGLNHLYFARMKKNQEITQVLINGGGIDELEDVKKFKKRRMIKYGSISLVFTIFLGWCSTLDFESSSSGSSIPSSGTHTCTQCGKTYTGSGWSTVGGEQYKPSSDPGYDRSCSKSCAYDSQPSRWKR